jgi:hypothetical protein
LLIVPAAKFVPLTVHVSWSMAIESLPLTRSPPDWTVRVTLPAAEVRALMSIEIAVADSSGVTSGSASAKVAALLPSVSFALAFTLAVTVTVLVSDAACANATDDIIRTAAAVATPLQTAFLMTHSSGFRVAIRCRRPHLRAAGRATHRGRCGGIATGARCGWPGAPPS